MSSKGKRSAILWGGAAILLALALLKIVPWDGSGSRSGTNTANSPRDQRTQVRTEILQPERLGGRVTTAGTVLSHEEVEVRSQVSGKIERIAFREGAKVKRRDLLVKINDDELQAQLLRAHSRLAIAEQQAERQRQLFDKKFVSEEEYNNTINELNIMKAEVQLIKAQIGKTEIHAPFDGTIGLRYVSEGSYLSPSAIITTLQDNSRVKIDFAVPEKYTGKIKVGDKITFRVQSRSEQFEGTIYSMDARVEQTTRTLRLRALAPNPRGVLLPGSFANIEVSVSERDALTIPAYALIPELKGHRVFLYKGGKAASQSVEIGTRTDERVEITKGLQAGDTLITSAILQLRPGMAVRPSDNQSSDAK